ncbi:tRNA (adenosine(37)-N6)-threonylcarbamoyltransferase complex dimerization subunit type 1 TsaB [Rugosimonospora africana]|uniref:tRNA (adenosine(37)-N6)-threonylcarbamoyltransferase complex dimerization subunit type 1 TsaB n=1 Tax=Rugosimonospora africana TaxID=556532 RepID=UPI00194187CA|nr:tRNA (adenosine(37)-N6)-threonylcarbamoyltransferase complex dimerization subunit type 1 TsaB [Rugosimonospora africana]
MLIVVVDSATPAVTAALASVDDTGVELLAASVTVDARAHGELLAPAVTSVLAKGGATPKDLDAVVAGLGPGPFTGLRVGLVTAAALADSLNIPAYGVCSLDALGWAAGPGRVLVATDARRKEIYWAVYEDGVRLTDPAVGKPADVLLSYGAGPLSAGADPRPEPHAARLLDGTRAAVGDGAHRYADILGLPVLDEPRYPPAAGFAALAADRVRDRMPTEPLTPLYLRRPDAVLPGERKPALR